MRISLRQRKFFNALNEKPPFFSERGFVLIFFAIFLAQQTTPRWFLIISTTRVLIMT